MLLFSLPTFILVISRRGKDLFQPNAIIWQRIKGGKKLKGMVPARCGTDDGILGKCCYVSIKLRFGSVRHINLELNASSCDKGMLVFIIHALSQR